MGCTPSVHVSQTGVVYGRESEDSNSPRPSAHTARIITTTSAATTVSSTATALQALHSHSAVFANSSPDPGREGAKGGGSAAAAGAAQPEGAGGSACVGAGGCGEAGGGGGGRAKGKKRRDGKPKKQGHLNAVAAASSPFSSLSSSPSTPAGVTADVTADPLLKETEGQVSFRAMRFPQKPLSIMLVFPEADRLSNVLELAAQRLSHACSVALSFRAAQDMYQKRHYDVIFIDRRSSQGWDADAICRSLKTTNKNSDYTVMVAVCRDSDFENEESSISPVLKAGFTRLFSETLIPWRCAHELTLLASGEVHTLRRLRACEVCVTALDYVSDAVEITSDNHLIQYVNPAYERNTGFTKEELIGKDARELTRSDRNREIHDVIAAQTKKGKHWEGTYYTRRKSGESVPYHCKVTPVFGPDGKICQYVTVKSVSTESFTPIANGGLHSIPRRRESMARLNSTMIEAPITKVINLINAAQESCPLTVAQALEKVVEILRTSELYAPHISPQLGQEDDPMTSDLVGGLVSQNMKRRMSGNETVPQRASQHHFHQHVNSPVSSLAQTPEQVLELLEKEPTWTFDIIQLEETTSKRPLMYLGWKTFARFEVCQFLSIEESMLVRWLQVIEENYHASNPYHNSTHAADVLHASAFFLECERTKLVFDTADCVACLIAATIHDVDHPARTNAFLVNESNPLALLYNDLAVLESHHASLAFRLTQKDDSVNIFKNLSRDEYRSLRQSIVDMVLATEMKQHFEHLNKFTNSINKNVLKCDTELESLPSPLDSDNKGSFDNKAVIEQLSTPENKTLIKRMLIKCADVSNPVRPWKLCAKWAERIAEEYCSQTDEEKTRNLPIVMPVFDRKTCSIPKSQTSFVDVFINTMFDAWDYYCDIPELMQHLQTNYKRWKALEDKPKDALASSATPKQDGSASAVSLSK